MIILPVSLGKQQKAEHFHIPLPAISACTCTHGICPPSISTDIFLQSTGLPAVVLWVGPHSPRQKVTNSIPGHSICLGCGFSPQWRCIPEAIDVSLLLFLPPFPLSKKQIKSLKYFFSKVWTPPPSLCGVDSHTLYLLQSMPRILRWPAAT